MKREPIKLAPGDLAIGSGSALQKYHLVRVTQTKLGDLVEEWRDAGEKYRAKYPHKDPTKLPADDRDLFARVWSADALCGVENQKVTFGNRQRFYWRIASDRPRKESICKGCLAAWRRADKPAVRGWSDEVETSEPRLPFAWREVPATKHPRDVGEKGDPASVLDRAGEAVGVRRTEVRRWVRGDRYVRVAQLHDEDGMFGVLYGFSDEPDGERQDFASSQSRALAKAHELMALGGTP